MPYDFILLTFFFDLGLKIIKLGDKRINFFIFLEIFNEYFFFCVVCFCVSPHVIYYVTYYF